MTTPPRSMGGRAALLARFPEYATTNLLDDLRATEYRRLEAQRHIYLDYTGAGLHAESQVTSHAALLNSSVFGNPHSVNPSSESATRLVEDTRREVLAWFNAQTDYTAIFTANATGGLKHIAESYPFSPASRLLLTVDNHNSVNGIRERAARCRAYVTYAPLTYPELRLDRDALHRCLIAPRSEPGNRLFAFPAQSNFSGVQHPLEVIDEAQASGWDVLLDAAAFVPTNRLDLTQVRPEFVTVSFYKMFGYPTGVGCLLIRKDALSRLVRPWFAGGTVDFATVTASRHLLSSGEARFEDGTLNFQAIPAVATGLRHLDAVGLDVVRTRVRCLTGWLLEQLMSQRHSNGRPMVRLYGPTTTERRGGTVTMNLYDPDGHLLDYRRVEELAAANNISLRTGCFCNPGAGEVAEGITEDDILSALASGQSMNLPRFLQFVTRRSGKSVGAIRVSLGIVSNIDDVEAFLGLVSSLRDQTRLAIGEATFDIDGCRVIRDGS